jgi:signal transduction histidine kinase
MKIFILTCHLCILSVTIIIAQNPLPPSFAIATDKNDCFTLPKDSIQVLEDNTGKLSFEQVSTVPLISSFHINNEAKINPSAYAFWYRYRLMNTTNHNADISINTIAEYCDIYIKTADSSDKHFHTGWGVPWSKKDGLKLDDVVIFIIKPGQEVLIYHRERYNPNHLLPKDISITYCNTASAIQNIYIYNDKTKISELVSMLFAGILILAAVFNFFFFSTTKDKAYLYFAMFAFFYGLTPYSNGLLNIFFREHPSLGNNTGNVGWFLFSVFLTNFFRHYLETGKYNRVWDRILVISLYIYVATVLLFALFEKTAPHVWRLVLGESQSFMIQLVPLLLFVVSLLYLKQKNAVRSKIIPALPVLFYWGVVWGYGFIARLLTKYAGYSESGIRRWIDQWNAVLDLVLLGWFVLFFSWSLLKRYQQLQKKVAQHELEKEIERNQLIARQKIELEQQVTERTAELKQSLENLKVTQSQLIQSEKMASLGELTAGIAHEIQNPLNFVNNFSEVNTELLTEMKEEIDKGNIDDAKAIANNAIENQKKINHHGKRADEIVKSMLQHSRSSPGKKEPVDINLLCDEYLRLSYHGLRAKDKSFNATMKTDFDDTIGNINIIPQDIGRVVLNLINNAFYAADEKKKQFGVGYDPTVTVSTKKSNGKVEIKVKDNGYGIPQKILDKIFQPFFTTKPTGQGTGLGLSLSYDIVKAHGGELKVETKEGEGSEFIIQLIAN